MNKLDEQLKRIKELLSEGDGDHGRSGGGGTSTNSSGQYMSAHAWQQGGILTKDGRKDDIGEIPGEVDITQDSETVTLSIDDVMGDDSTGDIVDVIDDLIGTVVVDDDYGDVKGDVHGDEGPAGDSSSGDDIVAPIPTVGKGCPCSESEIATLQNMGITVVGGHHVYCCEGDPHSHEDERADTTFGGTKRGGVPCCEPCPEKKGWWRRCNDEESDNPCQYATISDCELANQEGESNLDSLSLGDIWGTE